MAERLFKTPRAMGLRSFLDALLRGLFPGEHPRRCGVDLPASTPFIGEGGNNFSHYSERARELRLSHPGSCCSGSDHRCLNPRQMLFQCASLNCLLLSRTPHGRPAVQSRAKKTAAGRISPKPPSVFLTTRPQLLSG